MNPEDNTASGDDMMKLVLGAQRLLLQEANGHAMNQQAHAAIAQAEADIKTSEALLLDAKGERDNLAAQAERQGFRVDFILAVAQRAVSSMAQSGLDPSMVQAPMRRKPGRPSSKRPENFRMAVPQAALLQTYLPEGETAEDKPIADLVPQAEVAELTAPAADVFSSMAEDKEPDSRASHDEEPVQAASAVPSETLPQEAVAPASVPKRRGRPPKIRPVIETVSAPFPDDVAQTTEVERPAEPTAVPLPVEILESQVPLAADAFVEERTPEQIETDAAMAEFFPGDVAFDAPAVPAAKPAPKSGMSMGM